MINWSTDEKLFKKKYPEEYKLWRLTQLINYGLDGEKLEEKGHRFYSETDTEIIVHSYEEYGENCVSYFNGDFAFGRGEYIQILLLIHTGNRP